MSAARRLRAAVFLLVVGWALSAALVPGFRAFLLNGLHSGCLWSGTGWSCEDDPLPNLIVPVTEVWLAGAALLAILIVVARGRRSDRVPGVGRDPRAALVLPALLGPVWVLLLIASAVVQVDPSPGAAAHLGGFDRLAATTAAAVVGASVATVFAALLRQGASVFAGAAALAWVALLAVDPAAAWPAPLGLALLAAVLLPVSQWRLAGSRDGSARAR